MKNIDAFKRSASPQKVFKESTEPTVTCWRSDWYDPRWCLRDPKAGATFFAIAYMIIDGLLMMLYAKWAKNFAEGDNNAGDLLLNQGSTALACFYGVWCVLDVLLVAVVLSKSMVAGINMWLFATSARYLHLAVDPTLLAYTCVYHERCAATVVPAILSFILTLPLPWAQLVVMKYERSESDRMDKEHRIGRLSQPPSWIFPMTDTYGVPSDMKLYRHGQEVKTPDVTVDSSKAPGTLSKIHEEPIALPAPDIEAGPSGTSLARIRTSSKLITLPPKPVPLHGESRKKERGSFSVVDEQREATTSVAAPAAEGDRPTTHHHHHHHRHHHHQERPASRASRTSHATHASYATYDSRVSRETAQSERAAALQLSDFPGYRSRGTPSTVSGQEGRPPPRKDKGPGSKDSRLTEMEEVVVGPPPGLKAKGRAKSGYEEGNAKDEGKRRSHSKKKHRSNV